MLPTTSSGSSRPASYRSYTFLPTYLRRLVKPKQMDLEYTFWLMQQLLVSPKTAYRHTSYHKQTKNQWARDDPAFVVICCFFVAIASTAYCITFGDGVLHSVLTVISAVLVDFILVGCLVATLCWTIANKALKKKNLHHHTVEQHVEWMYAFDVHCNAYFPLFVLLYVLQFILTPALLWRSFFAGVVSNVLYVFGLSYYHYMNFLGYNALPFLENTQVFLWPIGLLVVCLPFSILTGFNPTRFTLSLYFG